jgi:predicted dehydrogenase
MSATGSGPVRVGLIGCGGIARFAHLRALARMREATLVAAADPDPEARAHAARFTRTVAADASELLARPDVEAVVVSVPPHRHADVVEAACVAGKHVYLEKPLAESRESAARIVAAAERSSVRVVTGFNRRAHPTLLRARAALRVGLIGRVRAIQSRFCEATEPGGEGGWRTTRATGGGVLLDLAIHHADLVRWLTGEEIVAASGRLASDVSEHDSAWIHWRLEGGAEVQGFFSWRAATEDRLAVSGESGVLRVDRHRFSVSIEVGAPGRYGTIPRVSLPGPAELVGRLAHALGHVYEPSYRRSLAAFADCIRGRAPALATLDDGRRALEAVLALEA